MHHALPSRKPSNPSPYVARQHSSRFPMMRRSRAKAILIFVCVLGAGLFIISRILGRSDRIPSGTPPVVIVTVVDPENFSNEYIQEIKDNRIAYAKRNGYVTFFPTIMDYDLGGSPNSWARVPAMRHALTKFSHSTYFWFLDQNSLIMNPDLKIESHIMNPKRLESLLLKEHPVVLPDSVIKTFAHLKGDQVDFVLTQDKDGLSQGSFVLRRGDWSKFFLDTWFDPLYRSYNFQKADLHALEHIVQWHPTILSKLAIIPQRYMNAYSNEATTEEVGMYQDGDLVIRFAECEPGGARDCATELEPFSKRWRIVFKDR